MVSVYTKLIKEAVVFFFFFVEVVFLFLFLRSGGGGREEAEGLRVGGATNGKQSG